MITYIKDMIFYDLKNVPFLRHLFSEINNWKSHLGKLEEGSVSPYFPSMMLGEKTQFHFDRNVALSIVFVESGGGGGVGRGRSGRPYTTPLLTILRLETQPFTILLDHQT